MIRKSNRKDFNVIKFMTIIYFYYVKFTFNKLLYIFLSIQYLFCIAYYFYSTYNLDRLIRLIHTWSTKSVYFTLIPFKPFDPFKPHRIVLPFGAKIYLVTSLTKDHFI